MSRGRRWEGKGEAEYLTIVITICCVGGGGWWTFVYYHKVLIPRPIVSHYFHHICWVLDTNYVEGGRFMSTRLFPPSDSKEIEESNLMRYMVKNLTSTTQKIVSMSITDLSIYYVTIKYQWLTHNADAASDYRYAISNGKQPDVVATYRLLPSSSPLRLWI